MNTAICSDCGEQYDRARWALGYYCCKDCGEAHAIRARASWCVAPLNKSNYILVTDPRELAQLNPKRTT